MSNQYSNLSKEDREARQNASRFFFFESIYIPGCKPEAKTGRTRRGLWYVGRCRECSKCVVVVGRRV